MKNRLLSFIAFILVSNSLLAQGVGIYNASRQTGITYSSISSTGNSITSWRNGSNVNYNRSFPVPIGFSFNYLGINFTQINVSLNGFIDFSGNNASGYNPMPYGYDNTSFSLPAPNGTLLAIAPFYTALSCSWSYNLTNSIKYLTTGTTGNRILTVEWIEMMYLFSFTETVNFQVKLYEQNSKIEFVYGSMTTPTATLLSYTCGINADSMYTVPTISQLKTQQIPNSASFSNIPQNALNIIPASNSKITLTGCILPAPAGSISGSTSVCEGSSALVYSVAPISNATGYTWTLPTGFVIFSGGNTNSITVNVGMGASSGNITVVGTNSCGYGASASLPVTVNFRPNPTVSGPSSACAGTTGHVYTTQPGMANYQWTISSGGTILSGASSNFITVAWNTAGAQWVAVNYTNSSGCSALLPTTYGVTVNPRPTPTLTGTSSVCVNSAGNVYTTQPGMTNYVWNVSSGGTITGGGTSSSNTITITWITSGLQSVSVNYTNSNGCTAYSPTTLNVTVNSLPVPTIGGPATACAATSGNIYTTQAGMTNYSWSVSSGGTINGSANTNSISVTWNTAGAQAVYVNYTNLNGCSATVPTTYNVTVYPRPLPTITGSASGCANTGGYVYTTQAGMTNYQWQISTGGLITGGTGTNSIIVTWLTEGAQYVSVNYTNSNGCFAITPTQYNVTVHNIPVPVITGPDTACVGSTGNIYATQTGMTNYLWTVSSGGTITSGGTSTSYSMTITWNAIGARSVTVSYTDPNGCNPATPTVYPVMVDPLPSPTISGPDSACIGLPGFIYMTEPGMTNYLWTVSSGGSITAGAGTSTITVVWSLPGTRTVNVNYTDNAGCTATAPTTYLVIVSTSPVPTITGPSTACAGTSDNLYVTEAGMSNYQWTVSAGGTLTSGQGTDSVHVTWNSPGSQSVSVMYTNAIGCNTQNPGVKNVTVYTPPVPTITGSTTPCLNSGNYPYSTQAGMSNYQWTTSSGGIITSGAGSPQVEITWIGGGAQWVQVNYTNTQGCSAITPTSLPVLVDQMPDPAGNITGTPTICGNTTGVGYYVPPIPNASTYNWSLPAGATITGGAGTNAITVTFAENASSGNIVVYGHNACGGGVPSPPYPVTVTPVPETPLITQNFDVLISSIPDSNQWYYQGNPIPGARDQSYTATSNGWYWDQVIVNSCSSETSNQIYVTVTGILEPSQLNCQVYPIPNDGRFNMVIDIPGEERFSIGIYDNTGIKIFEIRDVPVKGRFEKFFDLRPLPCGVYTMNFYSAKNHLVKRILIDN